MSTTFDFNQKQFLKSVRKFMKANRLTCRAFAKLSGVTAATLFRLEQGKNEVTLTTIKRLQKTMDKFEEGKI